MKDKRFTIIMSSDPSPITDAISKLAKEDRIKKLIDDQVEKAKKKTEEKAKEQEELKKKLTDGANAVLKLHCADPKYQPLIRAVETLQGITICPQAAPGGNNS